MEMTRCMLHEKELPKELWAEAANTIVFLLNRLPTRVMHKKTPFEAWFGYKPDLQNLKIFGCVCFSYVPQVKRDKLDKNSLDTTTFQSLKNFPTSKWKNSCE